MGSPPQSGIAAPAQRNFQRKFALRHVRSSKFVVPPTRERSKVRNNARLGKSLYRAAPGCQRDRGPSVSGRVQRNPFQGVPLGNFFLTVDAVLLCAAKKNGVETYQAGRALPVETGACRHGRQQKAPLRPAGRKKGPTSRQVLSYFRITLRLHRRARATRGWTARYACAPDRCR